MEVLQLMDFDDEREHSADMSKKPEGFDISREKRCRGLSHWHC